MKEDGMGPAGRQGATRGVFCGGGCSKENRRPKRWALAKVQHAETAKMSRVHDTADERVRGTWVGRSLELS